MSVVPMNARPKILIADDEIVIARTLELILTDGGFSAMAVHDGRSAVRAAEVWHPDILLSDVAMPEMDGFEAAKRIQVALPECRIVLFSAQPDAERRASDYRAQGYEFEFIAKPVHPSELLAQLACGDAKENTSCFSELGDPSLPPV